MKKNGFTLIELLAVLIILSVIMLITVVSVNSVLTSTKSSLSETQIKKIEDAAKTYYLKEGMTIEDTCIDISELITLGYIEGNEVKNPEDNKNLEGYVSISKVNNQYNYEYKEGKCKICTLADDSDSDGTISAGDKYLCKVKDEMEAEYSEGYTFYVLSNDTTTGKTNLIMENYICKSGSLISEAPNTTNKCYVTWNYDNIISEGPKDIFVEYQTGPGYLVQATSSWKTELALNEIYNDETISSKDTANYTNFVINSKARLPKYSELTEAGCTASSCPDYLQGNYWGLSASIATVDGVETNYATVVTFDNDGNPTLSSARLNAGGGSKNYGVRPVITLETSRIK